MQMCGVDHIALNHEVVVNVICWVSIVGVDATYFGSSQINLSGLFVRKKILHSLLVAKIQFVTRADNEIVRRKALCK